MSYGGLTGLHEVLLSEDWKYFPPRCLHFNETPGLEFRIGKEISSAQQLQEQCSGCLQQELGRSPASRPSRWHAVMLVMPVWLGMTGAGSGRPRALLVVLVLSASFLLVQGFFGKLLSTKNYHWRWLFWAKPPCHILQAASLLVYCKGSPIFLAKITKELKGSLIIMSSLKLT